MADVETRLRATLTDRAAYLDEPAPYAVSPALVAGVAARAGHLRRRRSWTQVGGAAAAVTVVGLLATAVVRGPDTAGPALPASSGTVSTSGWSDPGVVGSAAERSAGEASARASAQTAEERARANAMAPQPPTLSQHSTRRRGPRCRASEPICRQTDPGVPGSTCRLEAPSRAESVRSVPTLVTAPTGTSMSSVGASSGRRPHPPARVHCASP